jgi:hypothetical protein
MVENFKFESLVLDPILNCIKDNQEYLTHLENLPQLSKMGYMYNTLWYAGRICWGYNGILRVSPTVKILGEEYNEDEENEDYDGGECEDNPKYKIEMCDPINDKIENLIYDAWGQHVCESEEMQPSAAEFIKIVKEGRQLSDLEIKLLKIDKTMEDWVEIKTDPSYRYKSLYPDRKSVIGNLLCGIGNGYGWNSQGFIIEEASGADQDRALYGDWQNAKFRSDIQELVDSLLLIPEVTETLDASHNYILEAKKKRKEEEKNRYADIR